MLAAAAVLALSLLAGCSSGTSAGSSGKTLTVWWFEDPGSAMGQSWKSALDDFKTAHPGVTVKFEFKTAQQMSTAGALILNSSSAPDVMEYGKGNATAGLVASKGLLTDLTSVATSKGWSKTLSASDLALGRYNSKGIFGSGPLYGIPTYGEFVSFFYNKDMFAKYNIQVPATLSDLESAMANFKSLNITPLAYAAKDFPAQHLVYGLALSKANATWLSNYQALKAPLNSAPYLYAARTVQYWVDKGYISPNSVGEAADDMNRDFTSGTMPMMYGGSWNDGDFKTSITKFKWGQFLFPGNTYSPASTGNIWVVPIAAKNKTLAYDFINETLSMKSQNIMGNAGGVPIAANASAVSDPIGKDLASTFSRLSSSNGLGFYPDWPVPGYYDLLLAKTQGLVGKTESPQQFVDAITAPYNQVQSASAK